MKIAVIGTGYVGLVTGTCFADKGNDVVCVDIDKEKVTRMQAGEVPIYEPGLEEIFHRNLVHGNLEITTDIKDALSRSDVVFLALPTPPSEDGSADLSYVLNVADTIGSEINHYTVIVNKSTVPVGTSQLVMNRISTKADRSLFDVVSNPEFLKEGFAVADFMNPDRVVIGTDAARSEKVMKELYEQFVPEDKILVMDPASAEMTKYAANAFLATKISFMNEVANLSEKLGADIEQVKRGIGSDVRIGNRFLNAGIGYGGSCFPKDVLALRTTAMENMYDFKILDAVIEVNAYQKKRLFDKTNAYYQGNLKGKKFAMWGLAFKPDTDDIREAPSLALIESFTSSGAEVVAYDPEATSNTKRYFNGLSLLKFVDDAYECIQEADALLVVTEWNEFRGADVDKIKEGLKSPVVFDGRNIFDPSIMKAKKFHYESIGREVV